MKETLYSNNLPIFSGKNVYRLKNELMNLLDVIDWNDKCKDTIKSNFIYFLECFNNDVSFEGTSIRFCKEDTEADDNIEIVWDIEDLTGMFGFYRNNSHSYYFSSKDRKWECFGGEEGHDGFYCDYSVSEFRCILGD